MDVSVVTVTWNSREFIGNQIQSVKQAAQHISYEQFLVDNASSDGTTEEIKQHFPEVALVQNTYNSGFAAANNQVLAETKGEYLLFLNPDMQLEPGSLDALVGWMRAHPKAGIVGPALKNKAGTIEKNTLPRRFPTFQIILLQIFKLPHLFPALLNSYQYVDRSFNEETPVDTVRGSCLLVRRSCVEKIGFAFDPRYFMWFEDVDLCREVKKLGYEVWYLPGICALDYVGQSFKKANHIARQKQFFKSAAQYFAKWEPGIKSRIITALSPLGVLLVRLFSHRT